MPEEIYCAVGSDKSKLNILDFDLYSPSMQADPYKTYARMLQFSPVCRLNPGELWCINDYYNVRSVLKNYATFSSASTNTIMEPVWIDKECQYLSEYPIILDDPPRHTHLRMALKKKLLNDEIKKLIPFIQEAAREQVLEVRNAAQKCGGVIDFVKNFAQPYVGRTVSAFIGTDDPDFIPDLYKWVALLEAPPQEYSQEYEQTLKAINQKQANYFKKFIQIQRQSRNNNIITYLTQAKVEGKSLTDEELGRILEVIALAGFQAPTHALCHAVIHLAQHPGLVKELIRAPDKIPLFVEESLRFNSSVHFLFRYTRQAVTLGNTTIPSGAPVAVNIAAANRDPSRFANPDQFIITRENNRDHVAFGYGVHNCLGAILARTLMQVALETILSHFNEITCPEVNKLPWTYSLLTHSVTELPVRFRIGQRSLDA